MMQRSLAAVAALGLVLVAGCGSGTSDADVDSSSSDQASAAVDGGGSAAGGGAECGIKEIDGVNTRTFCGEGTATLSDGTATLELADAECSVESLGFAVNAGTIVLDPDDSTVSAETQYIGFAIPPVEGEWDGESVPDGTYEGIITGNDRGKDLTASAQGTTIVITDGGTAGTVSGTSLEGIPLTGSFRCS